VSQPANHPAFSRRTFITGAAATGVLGSGLLSACGSGAASEDAIEYAIVQRFPSDVQVPGQIRLPFSLVDRADFVIDGPDELGAQVFDLDGNKIGERITAVRRGVTPSPYYAFRTTIDDPGLYTIVIDQGPAEGANFQVFERSEVSIPKPGDTLAGFETPTVNDPGGVDPICTREPACEFHSVTLTEALNVAKPVAYFVGTPALCPTGSCTPALEALVEVSPDFNDDFTIVHSEVFTDTTGSAIAPAVEALTLAFEPAVFITDADGVVIERLDGLWDTTELRERLSASLNS
jgi:hypothetical protein